MWLSVSASIIIGIYMANFIKLCIYTGELSDGIWCAFYFYESFNLISKTDDKNLLKLLKGIIDIVEITPFQLIWY